MTPNTMLVYTVLSLLTISDGSPGAICSSSFKEVSGLRGSVSTTALVATYMGTISTVQCGVKCVEDNICKSFLMNKHLQQCRLNHRLLRLDMTNPEFGWKYYELNSSEAETHVELPSVSSTITTVSDIPTSTTVDSGLQDTTSSSDPCKRGTYCCREGLCLKLFSDQLYWQEASDLCISLGKRLFIIDSTWKQQLVVHMVQEMGGNDDIYIGGQKISSKWVGEDGRDITEFHWAPDSPHSNRNYLSLEENYDSWGPFHETLVALSYRKC